MYTIKYEGLPIRSKSVSIVKVSFHFLTNTLADNFNLFHSLKKKLKAHMENLKKKLKAHMENLKKKIEGTYGKLQLIQPNKFSYTYYYYYCWL